MKYFMQGAFSGEYIRMTRYLHEHEEHVICVYEDADGFALKDIIGENVGARILRFRRANKTSISSSYNL